MSGYAENVEILRELDLCRGSGMVLSESEAVLCAEIVRLRTVKESARKLLSKAEETRLDESDAMVADMDYFNELAAAIEGN